MQQKVNSHKILFCLSFNFTDIVVNNMTETLLGNQNVGSLYTAVCPNINSTYVTVYHTQDIHEPIIASCITVCVLRVQLKRIH